jgi:hypothetical protein
MEFITLLSSDHEEFTVPRAVAEESETIRSMLAETSMDCPVPLSKVQGKILSKVIEFCKFNVEVKAKQGEKSSKGLDEVRSPDMPQCRHQMAMVFSCILGTPCQQKVDTS